MQIPLTIFSQEKLQFFGEKIDFSINDSMFSVNGLYLFINRSNRKINQTILFPFAQGAASVKVKRVYNLTYNQNLIFQQKYNGISFKLVVLPKDTVYLNIYFSQRTGFENVYLLESTQTWNNPLRIAEYSLKCDNSIIIDSLSYDPDSIVKNVYYWTKENFYPKDNFKILIK